MFGRKSKDSGPRGGSIGGRGRGTGAAPGAIGPAKRRTAAIEMGQNAGSDGLPGRAGYANGPRTDLPTFFMTRRPDGKPERALPKKKLFG